jgi:HAD superfamily hydrolase (TIGR01509 family)
MIKAVLFDMDGVLYNSMPSHVRAWHETLSGLGVTANPEEFYMMEGRTGESTINVFFQRQFNRDATPEELEKIYLFKSDRFNELDTAEPMIGALEVLQKVKELGLKRIIVTGSSQKSLFEKIDSHYPHFFDKDLMVTAYDVQYGKPHPEPYLMALEKGGLLPSEAIVVENAPLGVEAARAAGIYTVAVNTGPLPDKILWEAGANALYPNMHALAENIALVVNKLA